MHKKHLFRFITLAIACLLVFGSSQSAVTAPNQTTLVSVASNGDQGNNHSHWPAVSEDGRFVAFSSTATNLVAEGTNGERQIFVHDRQTGQTALISVDSDGNQGDRGSHEPVISADGRFVAFSSDATNLVVGDTNNYRDVFVYDRQEDEMTRVSVDSDGIQGNNQSNDPAISADGRFVAFHSSASNLVTGDTNVDTDVFIHDLTTEETKRVSVDSGGNQGNDHSSNPTISADGQFVAFYSFASNLVTGDTNGDTDVFIHDLTTEETKRVSVDSGGNQGNGNSISPAISADGRFVAFRSVASNLVEEDDNGFADIFVHDNHTDLTTRVSVPSGETQGGNGNSTSPAISADGRFVAFSSDASNLVTDDTNGAMDIFVHNRLTGETTRVSIASDGTQGNGNSEYPSISGNGHYVAFESLAENLVPGDTNELRDIFVRGLDYALIYYFPWFSH